MMNNEELIECALKYIERDLDKKARVYAEIAKAQSMARIANYLGHIADFTGWPAGGHLDVYAKMVADAIGSVADAIEMTQTGAFEAPFTEDVEK